MTLEDPVLGLGHAFGGLSGIVMLLHQSQCDFLGEEHLAGMGDMAAAIGLAGDGAPGAHLEMDVIGAARIAAGEYGVELREALPVGELDTPQEAV